MLFCAETMLQCILFGNLGIQITFLEFNLNNVSKSNKTEWTEDCATEAEGWDSGAVIGEAVNSNVLLTYQGAMIRASETYSTLSFIRILPNKLNGGRFEFP